MKSIKNEKGSALVLTVLLVSMLGIIVAATSMSVTHNYKQKRNTLENEQTSYINSSAVEYTQSYLTKLINTTFTYVLYNDPTPAATPATPIYKDWNSYRGTIDVYNALADENPRLPESLRPEYAENPLKKPFATDARFNDTENEYYDSNVVFSNNDPSNPGEIQRWRQNMKDYSIVHFKKYMGIKLGDVTHNNNPSSPLSSSTTAICDSIIIQDITANLEVMRTEANQYYKDSGNTDDLISRITVTFLDKNGNGFNSNAIDDFLDSGFLYVKYTTYFHDGTQTEQRAKYHWDAYTHLISACDEYAENRPYTSGIEVKAYYE